jgi:hypothetical protein
MLPNQQFRLDIETGNGDYLSTPLTPVLPIAFKPLLDIIFGTEWLDSVHGIPASDLASQIDKGLNNLRDRRQFLSLTDSQLSGRASLENYLENLRDVCRSHPKCTVSLIP